MMVFLNGHIFMFSIWGQLLFLFFFAVDLVYNGYILGE